MRPLLLFIFLLLSNGLLSAQKTELFNFEPAANFSLLEVKNKYPPYDTRKAYGVIIYPHLSYHLNPTTELGLYGGYGFVRSDFADINEGNFYLIGIFARYFPQKWSINQMVELGDYKIKIRAKAFLATEYSSNTAYKDEKQKHIYTKNFANHFISTDVGMRFFLWKELYWSIQLGAGYNFSNKISNRLYISNFLTLGYTFTKKNK